MAVGRKVATALLVLAGVPLSIPAIGYGLGLFKIEGRPSPADPESYTPAELSAAWQRCHDRLPIAVVPLNPWGFATQFLLGDGQFHGTGQYAAMRVAQAHNHKHVSGGMGWWHLSGAALTIWVTRNWTAEQIAATLVRDEICARTPNNSRERASG
jgi:hypothetical protein